MDNTTSIKTTDEPAITVKDKQYLLSSLPEDVKALIAVWQECNQELALQQRQIFKTQAAIKAITLEIEDRVEAAMVDKSSA